MFKTKDELKKDLIAHGGNLSGIYKITRISDGKIYIGQSECIVDRIMQHIDNKSETNSEKIDGAIAIAADKLNDFTYEVVLALPGLNTEQLWLAESTYIAKHDSYNKGFNKTKGNHVGKYDHDKFVRKHVVSAKMAKIIGRHFKLDYSNKKVLLINLFDDQFVNNLKFNDCEVIQISKYFENQADLGNYIMEELKKYMGVKFDLIIANPPYRNIGANITKTIIDNIDFDEYVNLLPANDYIRNDAKDLYKYVELGSTKPLPGAFGDAAVTPMLAKIKKKKDYNRYISWEEFRIETYSDPDLKDYFYETVKRSHYAIDKGRRPQFSSITTEDNTNTILLGIRDMNHKHLSYDKQCDTFLWNAMKAVDISKLKSNIGKTGSANKQASHYFITFNTSVEKDNFAAFMYSADGFRFLSKVFTALNADSMIPTGLFLPKVDWTRSWTVEEILADYGYAQKEIDKVLTDLMAVDEDGKPKYKGMED